MLRSNTVACLLLGHPALNLDFTSMFAVFGVCVCVCGKMMTITDILVESQLGFARPVTKSRKATETDAKRGSRNVCVCIYIYI